MNIRKRTVSETETHRLVTIRGHSIPARRHGYEQEVEIVEVHRAEELLGQSVPSLRQRIGNSGQGVAQQAPRNNGKERQLSAESADMKEGFYGT